MSGITWTRRLISGRASKEVHLRGGQGPDHPFRNQVCWQGPRRVLPARAAKSAVRDPPRTVLSYWDVRAAEALSAIPPRRASPEATVPIGLQFDMHRSAATSGRSSRMKLSRLGI